MSKPRKIKLAEGTVLLAGFPKDVANKLEAYIAAYTQPTILISSGTNIEEIAAPKPQYHMPDKALGLREKSSSEYEVVVVKYNADTKDAIVEEVIPAGTFKADGISKFKMELFKRELI